MEEKTISSKRTRSVSSSSSSTESFSPTEKRSKSNKVDFARCEVQGEIEQETVFVMANKSNDPDTKLDKILKKLEKLDAIESTLRDMSSRLTRTETAVDAGLTTLNKEVSELRGKLMEKEEQINNLHMKHLYLESYSRRENLKFFGIEEKEKNAEEGSEAIDTWVVLCEFLKTALGFQDPRPSIEIQCVHRVGKSVDGKPRPMLARFLRFPDRERILRQGFKLKDTEFMILQDFPREIIEERRKMMPKLKEA